MTRNVECSTQAIGDQLLIYIIHTVHVRIAYWCRKNHAITVHLQMSHSWLHKSTTLLIPQGSRVSPITTIIYYYGNDDDHVRHNYYIRTYMYVHVRILMCLRTLHRNLVCVLSSSFVLWSSRTKLGFLASLTKQYLMINNYILWHGT